MNFYYNGMNEVENPRPQIKVQGFKPRCPSFSLNGIKGKITSNSGQSDLCFFSIIHLDYYNFTCGCLPLKNFYLLQTALAQLLTNSHTTVELGMLHWLPMFPGEDSIVLNCFNIHSSTLIGSSKQFHRVLSFLLINQKTCMEGVYFLLLLLLKE